MKHHTIRTILVNKFQVGCRYAGFQLISDNEKNHAERAKILTHLVYTVQTIVNYVLKNEREAPLSWSTPRITKV